MNSFKIIDIVNYFKRQKLQFYILLGTILLGAFLRFYNYPYRYSLGDETIRDAVIGIEGARQLQLPLTGPFSSLGPFTFGPWYAYQLIIFNKIFPNPYSSWIYLSIISVSYIFIIYKIGKILQGEKLGLVLAFIATISPAQIISATHLTNPNSTNLFAVLTIWIFLILLTKKMANSLGLIFGLILGIGINLHYQMAGLLIFPLILLLYKRNLKIFVLSILGIIISFIPLLFFELNSQWFNTRNIIYYLLYGKNAIYVPNRWLFYVRDFWPSFWADTLGIPGWLASGILVAFLIYIFWLFLKKKYFPPLIFIIIGFLVNFVLLRYYWGPRFFGYLSYLKPFIFIFSALLIVNIKFKKIHVGFLLLVLICAYSYNQILARLQPDGYTMTFYREIKNLEQHYPNEKFTLFTCSKKYKSSYNAAAHTILFILELRKKVSNNGFKLGLEGDCKVPKQNNQMNNLSNITPSLLSRVGIIDFSNLSESDILKEGWEKISFSSMYDSSARWWIKENL